jgi:hypothetical protein
VIERLEHSVPRGDRRTACNGVACGWGVVLGEVVGEIVDAALPMHVELALADAVADPIKAHIDGFGSLLLNCVVGNTHGAFVVSLDSCDWLGVAEFSGRDSRMLPHSSNSALSDARCGCCCSTTVQKRLLLLLLLSLWFVVVVVVVETKGRKKRH